MFKDHLAGHLFTVGEENLFDVQVDDRMERMLLGTSSEGRLLAAAALPGFFIYKQLTIGQFFTHGPLREDRGSPD